MIPVSWNREKNIDYHFYEGKKWLAKSNEGTRSTALSYSAFEFRLALERIIFQYWYTLKEDDLVDKDIDDIRAFKTMQNKIYEITGHQKIINKRFEFSRIPLEMLKIRYQLVTPNFGKMHDFWSKCSELCHVSWTIITSNGNDEIMKEQYKMLIETSHFIAESINGIVSWSKIISQPLKKMEKEFLEGKISKEYVQDELRKGGLWSKVDFKDNIRKSEFIGEAIPPSKLI